MASARTAGNATGGSISKCVSKRDSDLPEKTKQTLLHSTVNRRIVSRTVIVVTILIITIGLGNAISKSWLSDDAFISFRYAKNLSDGIGLVYNAGERVEGYTNFLWTSFLAGGIKLGFAPEATSKWLGLLSFAAIAGLLFRHSARRKKLSREAFIPLAGLAILLNRDMQVFATGGLETALFTLLVFAGYWVIIWRTGPWSLPVAGALFSLAALTRPDGLIFYAVAIGYIFLTSNLGRGNRVKSAMKIVIPALVIYLPYFLIRWDYYGQLLPNTYYAKSADLSYYSQGVIYLWMFLKTYYLFLFVPLVLVGAIFALRKQQKDSLATIETNNHAHRVIFALALALPYMFAVVRVGGDFMFARFFIPTLPLLYVVIEESLAGLSVSRNTKLALAGLALLTVVFRNNQYSDTSRTLEGIADESRYYPTEFVTFQQRLGKSVTKILNDSEAKVSFKGANAMLVYYANPIIAIEAESGLTDSSLAHQILEERGRPGHEKSATLAYLQERRVNFQFEVGLNFEKTKDELHYLQIGELIAYLVGYDIKVMDILKHSPNVRFVDFPKYVDDYISKMHTLPLATVRADYAKFKSFYFDYNSGLVQEQLFLERIRTEQLASYGGPSLQLAPPQMTPSMTSGSPTSH